MCHHEAGWHAFDAGTAGKRLARVICLLCTIDNPDEPANVCWEGKRS